MRKVWSVLLPVVGVAVFCAVTYDSFRWNQAANNGASRYFWWSAIRLDTDPLNRYPKQQPVAPCHDQAEDCVAWDPETIWIHPGLLPKALVLTALPAFAVGSLMVRGVGRLGVSQLTTFLTSMPLLIAAWFCFIGWLIDRERLRRREQMAKRA